MNNTISIRNQFCPNESCPLFGEHLKGNVIIHSKSPPRMRCNICEKTWVAHRSKWFYGLRTPHEKAARAIHMLACKISIRKIAQTVHVSPTTVQRWKNIINHH